MMKSAKCEIVGSENYAAVVVTVGELTELKGLDRLKGLPVFGYQAIVGKDTEPGTKMLVFVAGSQLSPEFTAANNLYRHGKLNADQAATGYLEDNRRIKAIRLRNNRSDALAMPLSSLEPILGYVPELADGAQFDTIDGHLICEKFMLQIPQKNGPAAGKSEKIKLVADELFPEHYDTAQYNRNRDRYEPEDHVIVTQKLHGTSVRLGRVPVARRLSLAEKIASFFGVKVQETEQAFVVGSRRVTKSVNGESKPGAHYYADDLWTSSVSEYGAKIPPGFVVYGELIGWTKNGGQIQGNYTYNLTSGNNALYVYRVTSVNENGDQFDLCWRDMVRFCDDCGLKTVPVLFTGSHAEFESKAEEFLDCKFFPDFPNAVALSDPQSVDEGVCIRSQNGTVTKHKSPVFLGHESAMMDAGAADMEAVK